MPLILLKGSRRWSEEQLRRLSGDILPTILPAQTLESGMITSEVCGGDLFAAERVYAVLDWELVDKKIRSEVADLYSGKKGVPQSEESVTLVIRAIGKDAKSLKADKVLSLDDKKVPDILKSMLASRDMPMPDADVVRQLHAILPDQYDEVADIADKAMLAPERKITSKMIAEHGFVVEDSTVFKFMDALRSANLSAIVNEARIIAPRASGDLPRLTGGIAWTLRRWIDQGQQPAKLRPLHRALSELDTMTKSSGVSEKLLFDRFVTRACEIMGAK